MHFSSKIHTQLAEGSSIDIDTTHAQEDEAKSRFSLCLQSWLLNISSCKLYILLSR